MASQYDSVKVKSVTDSVSNISWQHALGVPNLGIKGRGKNSALIIMAGMADSLGEEWIDTITVDGNPATIALSSGWDNQTTAYYVNPQFSYNTPTIQVNYSGSNPKGAIGVSYLVYNVHQTTPILNISSATATSASPSKALTASVNGLALYWLAVFAGTQATGVNAYSLSGRFPQLFPVNQPGDTSPPTGTYGQTYHALATHGIAASRTVSWTLSRSKPWSIHAMEINPAPYMHTLGV